MRIPKTVKKIALTVVVMVVIFVVAGAAYVYYVDSQTKPQSAQPAVAKTTEPDVLKPVKPAANAPEGVAIESFTTPVKAGDNSSVQIRANAGSNCTILVTYNSLPAQDSGLGPKTTDVYGFITWTWTVASTASAGTWPVKVTCVYNGRSGVVIGNLEVTK